MFSSASSQLLESADVTAFTTSYQAKLQQMTIVIRLMAAKGDF
tara:strand:+ start:2657 stop:2785 length:129 start_codon:yes stop_codon:yes gene_type:complete